jgi:hypothetical protein
MHKIVNKNNAFKLNEYQGTYEIVSGNVSDDGKFWMNWTIASEYDSEAGHSVPVKRDDGKYRNTPVKVILGDKNQAIENLRWLLGELEGREVALPAEPEGDAPLTDDDIPF